ncbi:MAG TPA: hypothetical protein VF620_13080 [Allosphingosinicella sp.]|jgi:NACalpha-BTF3-like transcription factor
MTSGKLSRVEVAVRIATTIALALLAIGFVWTVSAEHSAEKVRAHERAHQYAQGTLDRIERACRDIEVPTLYECVTKEIAASREAQRDEYDLSAQNQMADWAFWMMIVSAVTTAIAGWALWYVKGTLDETRAMAREAEKGTAAAVVAAQAGQEANRMVRSAQFHERIAARTAAGEARRERQRADARADAAYAIAERNADLVAQQVAVAKEAAERQLRAYLSVNNGFAYGMNPQRKPTSGVLIKNQGQTPAYKVRIFSMLNWTTDAPEDVVVRFTEPAIRIGTLTGGDAWTYQSETAGQPWPSGMYAAVMSKHAILVYSGVIVYHDVFRKRRLTTFKAFLNIENIADDNAGLTLATRGNQSN